MRTKPLAAQFEAYADWRRRLAESLQRLCAWLRHEGLLEAQSDALLTQMHQRLALDQLVVAVVAEFSRGKSELINAIFFADFGRRLLPSAAGRTTMCPTELMYTPAAPPSIRLLPIETRAGSESVTELKSRPAEWVTIPLNMASADRIGEALAEVSRVRRVPVATARQYGLYHEDDALNPLTTGADGTVEIPCWRHAIVNFPHTLLQQGLVVLDTPGLNAIGAEPDLTLNLLPNAHATLFVLAAESGVTRTDVETWRSHLAVDGDSSRSGRFVVLNKIDTLWDGLRSLDAIDAEIEQQAQSCAAVLAVPRDRVYPVSAQKGLVGKVKRDDALLARSRLPELEAALSRELLPGKRDIVGEATRRETRAIAGGIVAVLEVRLAGTREQLVELRALRGRNRDVAQHMLDRIREERESFEARLQDYLRVSDEFTRRANELGPLLGLESLRQNAARTRRRIEDSPFTPGVRAAMGAFFDDIRANFSSAAVKTAEIDAMMAAAYERFFPDRRPGTPEAPRLSLAAHQREVQAVERAYAVQLDTLWNMISKEKYTLQRRFFETIATRMKHLYDAVTRDLDAWLHLLLSPLEAQVREQQAQLRRRFESVRRVHDSAEELEGRIADLERAEVDLAEQLRTLAALLQRVEDVAIEPQELPIAANS